MRPHRRQPTRLPRPWDSPGKNAGVGCHFLQSLMTRKQWHWDLSLSSSIFNYSTLFSSWEGEKSWEGIFGSLVTKSCPTLHDPMDCSLLGSSVHGIFQVRVLEWGAIAGDARFLIIYPHCYHLLGYYLLGCKITVKCPKEVRQQTFKKRRKKDLVSREM